MHALLRKVMKLRVPYQVGFLFITSRLLASKEQYGSIELLHYAENQSNNSFTKVSASKINLWQANTDNYTHSRGTSEKKTKLKTHNQYPYFFVHRNFSEKKHWFT
jgi:hypothetical protein